MTERKSKGNNTLFNYFIKSPTPNTVKGVSRLPHSQTFNGEKRDSTFKSGKDAVKMDVDKNVDESIDDDDVEIIPPKKRIRILVSDDSDEENTGNNIESSPTSVKKPKLTPEFQFKNTINTTPTSTKKLPNSSRSSSPSLSKTKSSDTTSSPSHSEKKSSGLEEGTWTHNKLEFLKPNKIRDDRRKLATDPDYDPKTLYVPDDFKNSQTPAMRQWWEVKSKHYDCVLFFKVGKFYELYHMDAVVGVNELGFSYMKGEFAHSGFPESAYARMSTNLVERGYKVARVEQTETPEMMQERCRKQGSTTKYDKVVRREVCQVTNKGTTVSGPHNCEATTPQAVYMMAIVERDSGKFSEYGVCFVDTSIGDFYLGQFTDDRQCSRLLTLLAHYPPALVLHERNVNTERTRKVFTSSLSGALRESLGSDTQFWNPSKTLQILAEKYYHKNDRTEWPSGMKEFLSDSDTLGMAPKPEYYLAMKALGGSVWYLKDCLLDQQVLSMARFHMYTPPDLPQECTRKQTDVEMAGLMILDAVTLYNLRIIGTEGSLLGKLDHCSTPFGKRLLRQWVCSPSCEWNVIRGRQKAVEFMLDNPSILQNVRAQLGTLPDLERHLAHIHSSGNAKLHKEHPDSRAIFYEEKIYSKRRIQDFIATLNGFQVAKDIAESLQDTTSELLKHLTRCTPEGMFPDLKKQLKFFKNAFNHAEAEKEGRIVPKEGVDADYDSANKIIADIEVELQDYLKSQERHFGCKISYFGNDKKRFTLEVPEHACKKAGKGYHLEGQKKGKQAAKRFSTAETKDLLARMIAAEHQRKCVLKDLSRRIFEKFSKHYELWSSTVTCMSILDVLAGLSEYSRLQSHDMCMPKVIKPEIQQQPFVKIVEGRHPCMGGSEDFIPNSVFLGTENWAPLSLLTGPNMGGKSTLMRQLGLLTIMAQIGCCIPATEASIVLVDRIFTRLGANDDLLAGHSTFLVELSETSAILRHATKHSLVLLDELGRGTSTYDGTAIAAGVLNQLAIIGCRTLFSTHYHSLVEDFQHKENVSLGHMACMVESEEQINEVNQETVTFLYKYIEGPCPKSYGFNAARLAGISKQITHRAYQYSTRMETMAARKKLFLKLIQDLSLNDMIKVKEAIALSV